MAFLSARDTKRRPLMGRLGTRSMEMRPLKERSVEAIVSFRAPANTVA